MNKNKMEILGGTLAGMMFLSGCKPASETNKTPVVDASATLSGPTTKESPYVTYSPTKEAVSTATPTRPDMGGGAYSSEQQTLIETGAFKDSEQALTAWFKYWANASNSPFNPETTDIHYKYVFDSTGKNAGVCMESTAYSSVCFALPIINGEVAKVPPTVSGEYTIPVGYGPLQLSDQLSADQVSALKLDTSLTDSVLGYEYGDWVRYKNGEIVASLDLASAQWVAETTLETTETLVTPTDVVTATEVTENIEGVSTQEQIQSQITDYLSGKVDYTTTGPNKDYLFVDNNKQIVPFSKIMISQIGGSEVTFFLECQQEGVYLGSFVLGSDERIISVFGTKNPSSKQPIVEFFMNGFVKKPDFLSKNVPMNYAWVSEKKPLWYSSPNIDAENGSILGVLSGKEGKNISWLFVSSQTQTGIDGFTSLLSDDTEKQEVGWYFSLTGENNMNIADWLQDPSKTKPDYIFTDSKSIDFSKFDENKIPALIGLLVPKSSDSSNQ